MNYIAISIALFAAAAAPAAAANAPAVTLPHAKRVSTAAIKGSVASTCTLSTAPFSFVIGLGAIHGQGSPIVKQGTLGVKCTKGASAQIGMSAGLYGSAAGTQFGTRSMRDAGGDYLGYELCHDSACASVWQSNGYSYVSPGDKGSTLPVWTRIRTSQPHVKQGSYSDSVTVTISF